MSGRHRLRRSLILTGGYGYRPRVATPCLESEHSAEVRTAFVRHTPLSQIPGAFSVLDDLYIEVMDRRQEIERAFQCASNQTKYLTLYQNPPGTAWYQSYSNRTGSFSVEALSNEENAQNTPSHGLHLILSLVQRVVVAAGRLCNIIDKVSELVDEEKRALKGLHDGVLGLRSDAVVYRDLIIAMGDNSSRDAGSPFSQRCAVQRSIKDAIKANTLHQIS